MYRLLLRLTDVRAILLAVWLLVQPWAVWPSLFPDPSHRLTLVVCCAAMGLVTIAKRGPMMPLPRSWLAVGVSCLIAMLVHSRNLLSEGAYFKFFHETSALSDGLIVLIAGLWGLWALRQLPTGWFVWVRWAGVAMLLLNLVFMGAQASHHPWSLGSFMPGASYFAPLGKLTGVLGYDRLLGAYGVAWLPILLTWSPWLALLPFLLILASGKITTWIGALVAVWMVRPRWRWMAVPASAFGAWKLTDGTFLLKIPQRLLTWQHLLRATLAHPFTGWGFSPLVVPQLQQQYGYILPSVHSDWLSLAVQGGWVVTGTLLYALCTMVCAMPRTTLARALASSLGAIGVMSAGQSVVSHARIAGLVMVLAVWWLIEQEPRTEDA